MTKVASMYSLGGFAIQSEIPLPELPLCEDRAALAPVPAKIRIGSVPFILPGGAEVDADCLATASEYLLRVPGVARYRVAGGNDVVVEPAPRALPLDVRAYLLGAIFSVLCHQRGLLPLHASAVGSADGVTAFLGRSGQGKSSLAAHLARRGFRVVADDICPVDTGASSSRAPHANSAAGRDGGPVLAIPAAPSIKLWRSSLEQLGYPAAGLEQVFSEDDKYRLPLENAAGHNPLEPQPIRKLVFLPEMEPNVDGGVASDIAIGIQEVAPLHALAPLMSLVHQAYLLEAMGKREETFLRCGQLLSQARAYRLIRPWGFAHMERTVDAVVDIPSNRGSRQAKLAGVARNGYT